MKDFKIDPQQMEQLRQQMEELRKSFSQEQMKQFEQQMEQFSATDGEVARARPRATSSKEREFSGISRAPPHHQPAPFLFLAPAPGARI